MVLVQTGSETVSGNMGMPRPGTKRSRVFGKIPDRDRDHGVWSGSDRVPIGLGPNFPNTNPNTTTSSMLMLTTHVPSFHTLPHMHHADHSATEEEGPTHCTAQCSSVSPVQL